MSIEYFQVMFDICAVSLSQFLPYGGRPEREFTSLV